MESRWSDAEAARLVERWREEWGEALALRTYSSRLLGAEPALVLHGGGNTSVKGTAKDLFGDERPALFVKASGRDLATATPADHVAVDLERARRLATLGELDDRELLRALRAALLDPDAPHPSIETPVHAAVPGRFVDHTHADAVLALTNRPDGEAVVREALGGDVVVLPYAAPGLPLARAVAEAVAARPDARAMVWMRHGLVTWGGTARESYEATVELATRAERFVDEEIRRRGAAAASPDRVAPEIAAARLVRLAPAVRGALATASGDPDRPFRRVILQADQEPETLELLASPGARESAGGPPLTADHLIRTGPWPLWLDSGATDEDPEALRGRLAGEVTCWNDRYRAYLESHRHLLSGTTESGAAPPGPRVVLVPGVGIVAAGPSALEARVALDVARHTLRTKARMAAAGAAYQGLSEEQLVVQEHRPLQRAKLGSDEARGSRLPGTVALVTGAAGAIGSGVARALLEAGAHVVATDLRGERLDALAAELAESFPHRAAAAPMDVTDAASVAGGFDAAARRWGGVDLLVVNAGAAHVAPLAELDLADFERLERINVHGTLLVMAEGARRFRLQGTGGDVVLVSTKNVFAPGASFGAYSATKAAAHQLARVASQELAPLDVRVNMVAPDAVFAEGDRRSGLWAEVGPPRMRARGLTEEGLEEYYRERNLLKARVTARHVANAVLYFATRQSPTTGATIPVDGGLPDATPR